MRRCSERNDVVVRRRKRRGQSIVEFSFVGIPIMFMLISIFEVSRGMWNYHTLAYAVKEGVRYATVHGADCFDNVNGSGAQNNCTATTGDVAWVVQNAGVGLTPSTTQLTFTSHAGTVGPATLLSLCAAYNPSTPNSCHAGGSLWPPNDGISNTVGQSITIKIQTPFNSAIALFWPGAKPTSFGSAIMYASSQDNIRF